MIRVSVKPRRKNSPRIASKHAPGFLQWLRGRECLAAGRLDPCAGNMEAAHVDYMGGKGVGTKVPDRFAIPLCSFHHRQQHDLGWETFEFYHQINAADAAQAYWRAWPGRIAFERKLEASR